MKDGEPTITHVFEDFVATVKPTSYCIKSTIQTAIVLLTRSISYSWDCHDWGAPDGGHEEAFATTHGASRIAHEIPGFCGYFIIHKCMMEESEKRKMYATMSKLTDYLSEKGYIDAIHKKAIKGRTYHVSLCRWRQDSALQKLHYDGYWKSLEREIANENKVSSNNMNAEEEPASKKRRTDEKDDDDDDVDDDDSHIPDDSIHQQCAAHESEESHGG